MWLLQPESERKMGITRMADGGVVLNGKTKWLVGSAVALTALLASFFAGTFAMGLNLG